MNNIELVYLYLIVDFYIGFWGNISRSQENILAFQQLLALQILYEKPHNKLNLGLGKDSKESKK